MADDRFRLDPVFIESRGPDAWPRWPSDYIKVAEVEASGTQAREDAYRSTQNGLDFEMTTWLVTPHRSSSPGDIVECPDGRVFRVLFVGWQEITVLERLGSSEVADAE